MEIPPRNVQGHCTWPLYSHLTLCLHPAEPQLNPPNEMRPPCETGSGFASHLHKYLLIVIKLNRNTQCTSGVRREFHLRYKRKVKLRVSVRVSVWVCRLWVCIFASCVWMPDLPPVARGSPFAPFSGKLPEGALSPLPAHLLTRAKRKPQTKKNLSSHRKTPGAWRPTRHIRAGAGLALGLGLHPQPGMRIACEERGFGELSSLCPRTPAPGLRARAVWCACVCLSCKPSLPKPTPPTVCHSIQIWKQIFKKQHDAQWGRGGGGQWHWGPKSPSH